MVVKDAKAFAKRCRKSEVPRHKVEEDIDSKMKTIEWDINKGYPVATYKMKAYEAWKKQKELEEKERLLNEEDEDEL